MEGSMKGIERIAVVETEVKNIKKAVDAGFGDVKADIKTLSTKFDDLDKKYVSRAEFTPVRAVAYTLVGATGLAVLGGVISLVIK